MVMKTVLIWKEDMSEVIGSVRYDDKFINKGHVLCPGPTDPKIPYFFPRNQKEAVEDLIAIAKVKAIARIKKEKNEEIKDV